MADERISLELKIEAAKSARTMGELVDAVEELKAELQDVEIGSTEFKELANSIASAESEVKALEKTFEGLEPDAIAGSFAAVGESIVGGFAAATGAAQLFGVETAEIEQATVSVQAAIAMALGARSIVEGTLQVKIALRATSEAIANAATGKGITVTKLAAAAQWLLNAAMNANPIMLGVGALAALTPGMIAYTFATRDA